MLESDSLLVINVLKTHQSTHLRVALAFLSIEFLNVPRVCNEIAHILAKFALSIGKETVWVEEPPGFIEDLLIQELSISRNPIILCL